MSASHKRAARKYRKLIARGWAHFEAITRQDRRELIRSLAPRIAADLEPAAVRETIVAPRKKIVAADLRALTDTMPRQAESAGSFVRAMRDGARY